MTSASDYDWEANPVQRRIDVDLRTNGDEWIAYLFRHLTETCSLTGYAGTLRWPFGYIYTPSGGTLNSSLLVMQSDDHRPVCRVLGYGEPRHDDLERWAGAIFYAANKLGETEAFRWFTTIGEDLDSHAVPPIQLKEPCRVGDIVLYPGTTAFMEVRTGYSLSTTSFARTFLVQATGIARGFDAWVATHDANKELKLLCSLLSLASGRTWILRGIPNVSLGTSHITADELPSSPMYSSLYPEDLRHDANYPTPTLFHVPGWLNDALTRLNNDEELAKLAETYHEGLLLSSNKHTSHSLLAFVSIIEAIGNKGIKKLPRCHGCERCKGCGTVMGSSRRFRAALARVMDQDKAESLGKLIYDHRSKTVHSGILYGTESAFGMDFVHTVYSNDGQKKFEQVTQPLREAAAQLLRLELAPSIDHTNAHQKTTDHT